MITKKHNGHAVRMYDSIEDLPATRYHKFNKYIMLDSGIGSDLNSISKHISTLRQMNQRGDKEAVDQQLLNMHQNLVFCIENVHPGMLAFASLVHSINGRVYDDISDSGLQKVLQVLNRRKFSIGVIMSWMGASKKKLRPESKTYFRNSTTTLN